MFVGLRSQRFFVLRRVGGLLDCITLVSHRSVRLQTLEKFRQLGARKLPLEGVWLSVGEFFVEAQTLFDFCKTGKVVRREHLALHDREVDFHLIEPTGMARGMHHNQIGVGFGQPLDSRLARCDEPLSTTQKTRAAVR